MLLSFLGDIGAPYTGMLVFPLHVEKAFICETQKSTHTEKRERKLNQNQPTQQIYIPFWHRVLINLQWKGRNLSTFQKHNISGFISTNHVHL